MDVIFHMHVLFVTLTLTTLSVAMTLASDDDIDMNNTIECHMRTYTYTEYKDPVVTEEGKVLQCSGSVTVNSCWGRCDSKEIADYKIPYKVSTHNVCTYSGMEIRMADLDNCDDGYPEPYVEVFEATGCECSFCSTHDTSCETLNG